MADDADRTQDRMEAEAELLARQPRLSAMPTPNGRCIYCGELLAETQTHFCSTECGHDWQREQTIRRAQGLAKH
jgi:hypothetical protein